MGFLRKSDKCAFLGAYGRQTDGSGKLLFTEARDGRTNFDINQAAGMKIATIVF